MADRSDTREARSFAPESSTVWLIDSVNYLEARVAALKAELATAQEIQREWAGEAGKMQAAAADLEAERATLREEVEWHKATKQALMDAHEAAVRERDTLREALRTEIRKTERGASDEWIDRRIAALVSGEDKQPDRGRNEEPT